MKHNSKSVFIGIGNLRTVVELRYHWHLSGQNCQNADLSLNLWEDTTKGFALGASEKFTIKMNMRL